MAFGELLGSLSTAVTESGLLQEAVELGGDYIQAQIASTSAHRQRRQQRRAERRARRRGEPIMGTSLVPASGEMPGPIDVIRGVADVGRAMGADVEIIEGPHEPVFTLPGIGGPFPPSTTGGGATGYWDDELGGGVVEVIPPAGRRQRRMVARMIGGQCFLVPAPRRMNPLNPRAARRAMRRLYSLERFCRSIMSFTKRTKLKGVRRRKARR